MTPVGAGLPCLVAAVFTQQGGQASQGQAVNGLPPPWEALKWTAGPAWGAGEASWLQGVSGLPDRTARSTAALGRCKLSWPLQARRKPTAPLHSRDANFLQVALSESQEDAEVHVLLLEHLQVLQTPNLLQQRGEVLEGRQARVGQRAGGDLQRHCGNAGPFLPGVHSSVPPVPEPPQWDSAAGAKGSSPLLSVPSGGVDGPEGLSPSVSTPARTVLVLLGGRVR